MNTRCSLRLSVAACLSVLSPFAVQADIIYRNPIVVENQKAGDEGWKNDRLGTLPNGAPYQFSEDDTGEIAGYASATSVNIGDSINLKVSVNDPSHKFSIDIYRLGWYQGKGGRLMRTVSNLPGIKQPTCPKDAATGLIECKWSTNYSLAVPTSWTTGIYAAMLTRDDGFFRRVLFVVRNDYRRAPIVYQQPVLTYQAYNCWPCNAGGKSLYVGNSSPEPIGIDAAGGTNRAVKVSFDRPTRDQYGNGTGDLFHEPDNQGWEMYLVQWMEQQGYDISYTTDIDTHRTRGLSIFGAKMFMSVGHDEYWSASMFNAAQTARNFGVNLAFMGANAVYWQVRLDPSSSGVSNRIVTCYKDATLDPVTRLADETIRWRDTGRPEQTLIGVQFTANIGSSDPHFPFHVQNSSNWVYEGSGFTDKSVVNDIVGYEMDRLFADFPKPAYRSYTRLGSSPFVDESGNNDISEASIYQAPSGAWVFATGTMAWSRALARPGQINPGIQRTTRNIINKFIR